MPIRRTVVFCSTILLGVAIRPSLADASSPPQLQERPAELHGLTGLSLNGRIHPHGQPLSYYFEYGPTTAYGRKTELRPLPPRLAAYYREAWDEGAGAWLGGLNGKDLAHHPAGGVSGGFVRFSEPSGHDPNHIDGIGWLHLCKYFCPGSFPSSLGYDACWGGGDPDLRDARVRIAVRGQDWKPNGSEIVWWSQSDSVLSEQLTANWRRTNWAYTGFSLNDALRSGTWERVDYRLNNDSTAWTYGGNNLSQKRPNYLYWPIDETMRHLNCDFFHLAAFVDPDHPPTGSIDFDDFEVAYRNYSLILPSNGGRLEKFPAGSADDPAALTDGWRHGPSKVWASGPNPAAPLEFVYVFSKPVTIETIQIHQHPQWPSRMVKVEISDDGQMWMPLLSDDVPEKSAGGPNFTFLLKRGLKAEARLIKVAVHSGYRVERWGLGEIELFGQGAEMQTDDDWYHVTTDVADLMPGQTYHYRLVAVGSPGTTYGPDRSVALPRDAAPHVLTGPATRIATDSAKVEGRLNPLGSKTEFYFEYGADSGYGQRTAARYGGEQITPRSAFTTLTGLKSGAAYHYRIVAKNAVGTAYGADATFTTK